ncbi:MAG: cytochrome C oxidase subunit IV family protein [Bacteriovoracaceae bacterium]
MGETAHKSHKKEYFGVFVMLTLLTGIELVIPNMQVSQFAKASSLTGLALGKAFLVAYSYMHLKDETKWLKFIAAVPMSAFLYALFVVLESMYR